MSKMRSSSTVARHIASSSSMTTMSKRYICTSCRRRQVTHVFDLPTSQHFLRRSYASQATVPISQPETPHSQLSPPIPAANPQSKYINRAGILLSRPPLLTAPLTPFESSFYFYQRRLNERLVLPFSQYFYFKRGTPAYDDWKTRRRERAGVAARDVGHYNAYGKDSWHDEALVGDKDSDQETIVRNLIEEEGRERFPSNEDIADPTKPLHGLRRSTEADRKNDTKSLERALARTLYLLVKKQKPEQEKGAGYWQFPSGVVEVGEGLTEAATRTLDASCGPNMNIWIVANHPVGHYVYNGRSKSDDSKKGVSEEAASVNDKHEDSPNLREKTFFLKSRIMAGQADIASNTMDILEYQWLSKYEIEKVVAPQYWRSVKNMLVER